jgi:hypothetical protein
MVSDKSDSTSAPELTTLLELLCASGVEFILVGGLAAVSQGAPITTFDIDIVPSTEVANIDVLVDFLDTVNARFRGRPDGQILRPTSNDISAGGHCLLMTDLGPLDVLGQIEQGLKFKDLLDDSTEIPFKGHMLRVLTLEAMVRMKKSSTRKKDQRYLPILEEILKRKPPTDS